MLNQKFRFFNGRLLAIIITLFLIGIEIILIYEHQQRDFHELLGHWIWFLLACSILVGQIFSQATENRRNITLDEFHSASIVKLPFLSKITQISLKRFIFMALTTIVLSSQVTLLIINILEKEALVSPILGISAMASLLVFQWIAQKNENERNKISL